MFLSGRFIRATLIGAVALQVAATLTACETDDTSTHGKPTPTAAPSKDPKPVAVSSEATTTVDLGSGARLIIPPGAIDNGAVVHATYKGAPEGEWGALDPLGAPIHLSTQPAGAIHGLLTLEFPAPSGTTASTGAAFGISTLNERSGTWTPVQARYDKARHMIVAQIEHFSWWNPFSWDWASIGAEINQRTGQLIGERASAAKCTRGQPVPGWVSNLAGVTNDAAIAIRACAEGEDGVLAVEIQNNRPYGMYLHYGAPVKWGWHEGGDSALDVARNKLADRFAGSDELYIPPLGRASVGIYKTSGNKVFSAGFGYRSLAVDVFTEVLGEEVSQISHAGDCLKGLFATPFGQFTPGNLRDGVVELLDCVTVEAGRFGYFDTMKISQLESMTKVLGFAGGVITLGDYEWKLLDLFVDGVVVGDTSGLGAGFSVYGKTPPVPEQTQPPQEPQQAPQQPAAPPANNAPPVPTPTSAAQQSTAPPTSNSNPAFTGGYFIADSVLGGTWPRTDPNDGGWYAKSNPPANAASYWWDNGLGVGFSCGAYAASYKVKFADGHQETWNTWLRSTDTWGGRVTGLWVPSAVADKIYVNGIPPNMPAC